MGLTKNAVGKSAIDRGRLSGDRRPEERLVALAGNPNVGKSTIFNSLTGMNQHTGNWPGKTVSNAVGRFSTAQNDCLLVDIPGMYSLLTRSAEEDVARSFLCGGGAEAVIVVCDATCLERNLNLLLQILELTPRVVVCVNLLDEAERRHIRIDLGLLADILGVPVVGTSPQHPSGLRELGQALDKVLAEDRAGVVCTAEYPAVLTQAVEWLSAHLRRTGGENAPCRWQAMQLLLGNEDVVHSADNMLCAAAAREKLALAGLAGDALTDAVVTALIHRAEDISRRVVIAPEEATDSWGEKLDRLLTGRRMGYPVMLLLLLFILWLTICGANYPSRLLSDLFAAGGELLGGGLAALGLPIWLQSMLIDGVYQVLTWIVAVMLPPMAIFFPLFTLLEDAGYLPRVAYNLDRPFRQCRACGKQALTMC